MDELGEVADGIAESYRQSLEQLKVVLNRLEEQLVIGKIMNIAHDLDPDCTCALCRQVAEIVRAHAS